MKILYLDEAGDHSLEKIEPTFPVFVLGGVILNHNYLNETVEPGIDQLKDDFFGSHDFCLHTAEIVRAKGAFSSLDDAARKRTFIDALTNLLDGLDFQVLACAIKKRPFLEQGGNIASNLYHEAFDVLVDRFCRELVGSAELGIIYAERRRADLDHDLEMAWERIRHEGTAATSREQISSRIVELILKDKRVNNAGLQLADLVVTPIGRAIAGYPPRADWDLVTRKLWGGPYVESSGLIVIPDQ